MMRFGLVAATLALTLSPLMLGSASAAPMSTSDLLAPKTAVEEARCYKHCNYYGYCGYGYKKYRCCKSWGTRCSYGHKPHHHHHHHRRRHYH
jgi:hypothetical protein